MQVRYDYWIPFRLFDLRMLGMRKEKAILQETWNCQLPMQHFNGPAVEDPEERWMLNLKVPKTLQPKSLNPDLTNREMLNPPNLKPCKP